MKMKMNMTKEMENLELKIHLEILNMPKQRKTKEERKNYLNNKVTLSCRRYIYNGLHRRKNTRIYSPHPSQ